jgi:hypothetical protein
VAELKRIAAATTAADAERAKAVRFKIENPSRSEFLI